MAEFIMLTMNGEALVRFCARSRSLSWSEMLGGNMVIR